MQLCIIISVRNNYYSEFQRSESMGLNYYSIKITVIGKKQFVTPQSDKITRVIMQFISKRIIFVVSICLPPSEEK